MRKLRFGRYRYSAVAFRSVAPVAVCVTALLASGCMEKKPVRAALPWASAVQVRPIAPAGKAPATENAPELGAALAAPQGDLVPRKAGPLRPRPPAPTNVTEPTPANTAPNLSPQLSAQDLASAQQQTQDSLRVAEQNLQRTKGKSLTALESDLVSKVSGFVRDARNAAGEGDWISARNLAKKAQVLSEELAGIL